MNYFFIGCCGRPEPRAKCLKRTSMKEGAQRFQALPC